MLTLDLAMFTLFDIIFFFLLLMIDYRVITTEERQRIEKIFSRKDLLYKSTEYMMNDMAIIVPTSIVGIGGAAAIRAYMTSITNKDTITTNSIKAILSGATGTVGAEAAFWAIISSIFAILTIVSAIFSYFGKKNEEKKNYEKYLENKSKNASNDIIFDCLKVEFQKEFEVEFQKKFGEEFEKEFEIKKNKIISEKFDFKKDNILLNTYAQIGNMDFFYTKLTKNEEKRLENYKKEILKYIKNDEETIVKFARSMRIYNATKKIGEFSKTLPKWHSKAWYEREKIKNQIITQCFLDPNKKKENKKIFDEITLKFYATYKTIIFLNMSSKTSGIPIYPREIAKFTDDLDKFISDRVHKNSRKLFDELFKQYRYLGGRCEFDPNNIFEIENFDLHYIATKKIKTKSAIIYTFVITALNSITCGIAGLISHILCLMTLHTDIHKNIEYLDKGIDLDDITPLGIASKSIQIDI